MHILCPECGKDHEVADEKLPAQKFKAICRGCKARFVVEVGDCPACAAKNQQGQPCPCGAGTDKEDFLEIVEENEYAAPPSSDEKDLEVVEDVQQLRPEFVQVREEHTLQFTGNGQEFSGSGSSISF